MPVERLSTRDPERHAWVPACGRHHIVVARHAADPHRLSIDVDL